MWGQVTKGDLKLKIQNFLSLPHFITLNEMIILDISVVKQLNRIKISQVMDILRWVSTEFLKKSMFFMSILWAHF